MVKGEPRSSRFSHTVKPGLEQASGMTPTLLPGDGFVSTVMLRSPSSEALCALVAISHVLKCP